MPGSWDQQVPGFSNGPGHMNCLHVVPGHTLKKPSARLVALSNLAPLQLKKLELRMLHAPAITIRLLQNQSISQSLQPLNPFECIGGACYEVARKA